MNRTVLSGARTHNLKGVSLTLEPGEFYLFHSWLLHGSEANRSKGRRAGVNMRYAAVGDEYEEQFEYIPL